MIDPSLTLEGQGRLSARAVVDTDRVKKERKPGGWLDPWQLVSGRLPVTASGILHTKDGIARLELRVGDDFRYPGPADVAPGNRRRYYSRTAEDPDGVRLDDPFPMAAGIKEIIVELDRPSSSVGCPVEPRLQSLSINRLQASGSRRSGGVRGRC